MLAARFGYAPAGASDAPDLLGFQREAVARATGILDRLGGVLIADSVGLGKTFVARELVRAAAVRGDRIAIVGPAALERHWRRALVDVTRFEWLSYERLSRFRAHSGAHDFIVFDEAHALRNPATRRYRTASSMCPGARVVLLTATPVNNSLWDLYHLLRLFAGDRAFAGTGVPSLRSAFEEAESACLFGEAESLRPILRAAVIRRTRPLLREYPGDSRRPGLAFPQHGPPVPVYYPFGLGAPTGALESVGADLLALRFPAHADLARNAGLPPSELMRRGLLKRLESSTHAFLRSLAAYEAVLERCEAGLRRGLLVRARDDRRAPHDDEQLRLDELLFEPIGSHADRARYASDLADERALVRSMRRACGLGEDGKFAALLALLEGPLRDRKVLVFTQFHDTARYLHNRLHRRFRTALVDGDGALLGATPIERLGVVRRFAPVANGVAAGGERERVDVLVATDVLSEGFNLQDASVVISYDLPWNPIRLAQRLGRIDRLGSPHAQVWAYAFLPGELDRYLGLVDLIARKTAAIEASVGSDMPLLHGGLARSIASAEVDRGDGATGQPPGVDIDERLRQHLRGRVPPAELRGHLVVGALPRPPRWSPDVDPTAIVAARVGGRSVWVAIVGGRAVHGDQVCARLIDAALCTEGSGETGAASEVATGALEEVLAIARPEFARSVASLTSAALLPRGGTAAAVGRQLLALVGALPGGPAPALCDRVDTALAWLATAPDRAVRTRFANRTSSPAPALADLLAEIEALPQRGPSRPEGPSEIRVDLIGMLVVADPDR